MNDYRWIHELIFGALVGNLVIAGGLVKFFWKLYKQFDSFRYRHKLIWLDYCKRYKIKPGREFYDRASEDTISE